MINAIWKSDLAGKIGISIYGTNVLNYHNADLTSISSVTNYISANIPLSISTSFNSGDYDYMLIRFIHNASATAFSIDANTLVDNIQLEEGSTVTSYEPYVGGIASPNPTYNQQIENVTNDVKIIIHGKNFFDKTNSIVLGKQLNQNNTVIDDNNGFYQNDHIRVNSNTTYVVRGGEELKILSYDKQKEFLKFQQLDSNLTSFTTPEDCYYIRVSGSQSLSLNNNLQIEEGNTQTDFEEYEGITLPFSLTDGQKIYDRDYLADDGIHHVKTQYTFNGTEGFQKSSSYPGSFYRSWSYFQKVGKTRVLFLCTHLKYVATDSEYSIGKCLSDGSCSLWLGNSNEFPNVTAFQTYLAEQYQNGTPVTIEYPLAQEEIEPYTQIQQQQYNAIKKAKSCNNITYIFSTSNELGFNMIATALSKETN